MARIQQLLSHLGRPRPGDPSSGWLRRISGFWLGKSAISGYLSVVDRAIVSGTNFLTFVIIGRVAGLENLGVFALAWTVLLAVNILQEALVLSPLNVYLSRFVEAAAQAAYVTIAVLQLIGLILLAVIGVSLFAGAAHFLGATQSLVTPAAMLVLAIPAMSAREFVRKYLFAKLCPAPVLILDAAGAAIQIAGLGVLWAWNILTPATALVAIAFATILPAGFWLVRNRAIFSRPSPGAFRAETGRHWRFGRWICLSQLSELTVTHGVNFLIAAIAGTAATGLFAACNSIILVINPLLLGISSILLPRAARANKEHGRREVARIIWKVASILAIAVAAISIFLGAWGPEIVRLFYDPPTLLHVRELMILLLVASFIGSVSYAFENGLLVVERSDLLVIASVLGLIPTLVLAAMLIPTMGVIGAGISVLAGGIVGSAFQIVAFTRVVGGPPKTDNDAVTEHD